MARKKISEQHVAGPKHGGQSKSSVPHAARGKFRNNTRQQDLNDVDREVLGALADFRDTLHARIPLEQKYTVRKLAAVIPPPQLEPDDVRNTRESLGVSQPVFAGLLGTSVSTIRSWEQGQKTPSPMARRLLALIASDPSYWKEKFMFIIET